MYLSIVPIVKRSAMAEHFREIGLPLMIVDDWRELLSMTEERLALLAQPISMQHDDVTATEADLTLLERDFGWKPATTLKEGVRKFVQWFRDYHSEEYD